MTRYKAVCKRVPADFVPFLERLTQKRRAEYRRGMAKIRRNFVRRMKRRHDAAGQTPAAQEKHHE